jgi:glycosyltransferase involved in cell wall biosynthesis
VLSKIVIGRSCRVIAISNSVKNFIVNSNEIRARDHHKIAVVYYGLSIETETIGTSSPIGSDLKETKKKSMRVCSIARVTSQKDYPTLLKALNLLKYKYQIDVTLDVIGIGRLREDMEKYAIQLYIGENVRWLGRIEKPESKLAGYDAFVLSTNYEGFGLVLLEAMNAGVPVLASNVPAVIEVLGEKSNSLFKVGDYEECAGKLFELHNNLNFRRRLLLENMDRLKRFPISKTNDLTCDLYKKCNNM